ncbi:MAG TPA: hypothetical protein VK709_14950 [Candidatus Saccharimonadales bacterium]|jgi:hypothetical protein|nr:hypothetical protein [Candidatus Saccharimonadales bacterium]
MGLKRLFSKLILLGALFTLCATAAPTFAKDKPVSWKEIDDALLRVNDAPVKDWAVFQNAKKRDPLLVQINNRFLLIKIHEREIYEVDPAKVQHKGDELMWDPNDHPAQPLAISDWDASDMEAVYRIRAKISAEDHMLDIELPHQLDLSGMSPHAASRSGHR